MKFLRFGFSKASNAANTSLNNNTSDVNISQASEAIEESPTSVSHTTLTNPNTSTSRPTSLSTSSHLRYPSYDSDSNTDSFSDDIDISNPSCAPSVVGQIHVKENMYHIRSSDHPRR